MRSTLVSTELLQAVTELAQRAGNAILQTYNAALVVKAKADHSPLTIADRASHDLIVSGLQWLTPDVPVLSEESAAHVHEYEHRHQWQRLWLVDPLDGTREFIERNGEFTVNIALIESHVPVMGVLVAPALQVTYSGARGLGAWKRVGAAAPQALHGRPANRRRMIVLGSRSHPDGNLERVLARLGPHELRRVGSALKFGLLADGTADFYPRFSPTSEWDTAAGQAVLECAGGEVTDLSGQPLRYNAWHTLLNPHFLAFADRSRDWRGLCDELHGAISSGGAQRFH